MTAGQTGLVSFISRVCICLFVIIFHFRDLNLGLAWSLHACIGTLDDVTPIQTDIFKQLKNITRSIH